MNSTQPSALPAFSVVIVAAGTGARFGSNLPKQYHKLHGKTILRHTTEVFSSHPRINAIQVVIADGFQDFYTDSTDGLPHLLPVVMGGATRQESVHNALRTLSCDDAEDIVFIHDAARPCLTHEDIDRLLESMMSHSAATLAVPVAETLRKMNGAVLGETVPRDGLYSMQTPQAFRFGLLKTAHDTYAGQNFTDDTTLVATAGIETFIVQGNRQNIKITMPEDINMAEKFLTQTYVPRTGLGFDVHAFGDESTSIRIGGVDISHTHKLKGHSDADVLLHAVTDALYGVIADGDIGSHFSPNNPDYKGKDSAFFLEDAVRAVINRGGKIVHVDSVIMCEAPKIGPHRDAIRQRIATIMGLKESQVSVKATTTEELGFTGRREGIAAQAIVTVLFPAEKDF